MEDTLTFPRIFTRFAYWRKFPPTHILVRAIAVGLGVYKPERDTSAKDEMTDEQMRAMFS